MYGFWMHDRYFCARVLSRWGGTLTAGDVAIAAAWTAEFQAGGLFAEPVVIPMPDGDVCVLEVHGAPNGDPMAIVFRTTGGYQADEFLLDEGYWSADLRTALDGVRI